MSIRGNDILDGFLKTSNLLQNQAAAEERQRQYNQNYALQQQQFGLQQEQAQRAAAQLGLMQGQDARAAELHGYTIDSQKAAQEARNRMLADDQKVRNWRSDLGSRMTAKPDEFELPDIYQTSEDTLALNRRLRQDLSPEQYQQMTPAYEAFKQEQIARLFKAHQINPHDPKYRDAVANIIGAFVDPTDQEFLKGLDAKALHNQTGALRSARTGNVQPLMNVLEQMNMGVKNIELMDAPVKDAYGEGPGFRVTMNDGRQMQITANQLEMDYLTPRQKALEYQQELAKLDKERAEAENKRKDTAPTPAFATMKQMDALTEAMKTANPDEIPKYQEMINTLQVQYEAQSSLPGGGAANVASLKERMDANRGGKAEAGKQGGKPGLGLNPDGKQAKEQPKDEGQKRVGGLIPAIQEANQTVSTGLPIAAGSYYNWLRERASNSPAANFLFGKPQAGLNADELRRQAEIEKQKARAQAN